MGVLFGASGQPSGQRPTRGVLGDMKRHLASYTPPAKPKAAEATEPPMKTTKDLNVRVETDRSRGLDINNVYKAAESGAITSPKAADLWGRLAQTGADLVTDFMPGVKQVHDVAEEVTGKRALREKGIDEAERTGQITHLQAHVARQDLLRNTEWVGKKDDKGNVSYNLTPAENATKAAGTAVQATTELMLKPAFKAAKGAPLIGKVLAGAKSGGLVGGIHAAGASMTNNGRLDAGDVAGGTAVGAGFGAGAELVAQGAGKVLRGLAAKKAGKAPAAPEALPPSTKDVAADSFESPAFLRRSQQTAPELATVKSGDIDVPAYQRRGLVLKGEPGSEAGVTTALETVGKNPETTIKLDLAKGAQLPATSKPNAPGENWSSRVKQYEQHLQETIANIEKSPAYGQTLVAKGGQKVIGNKQVYEQARAAGPLADEQIVNAKPLDKIDSVTLVRAKATLNQAASEFTDAWKAGKLDDEALGGMADRLSKLEAGYKVMSAEPGRATQIQSSFIDDAYKLQQKLADLQRTVKGPNKRQLIKDELDNFQKELERKGTDTSTARKWADMIAEYATAAKLTSPLTHFINVSSSLLTLPQKALEDLVKIGFRVPARQTGIGQARYVFGTWQGLTTATKQFAADLKSTATLKQVADVDGKIETKAAIPGKVGEAIRSPFKLLAAGDNFFKNLLRDRELNQIAYQQAWQEGHRGAALKTRLQELLKQPTEDMLNRATKVAEEFTFTNDPGVIATGVSDILGKVPLLRLLVPFVKTPTNVMQFQFRRSGLGIFSPKNIKGIMRSGSDREVAMARDDAVARLAVGSGLSIAGAMAAFQAGDNITGAAPTDSGEKDAFYASGKKPYAIKIGDQWVQYNRFQPIGMYLTQAVGLRDALMSGDSKTAGDLFSSFVVTTAKGMADLPYVSGVSSVIEALNNPTQMSTANKVFSGVLGGLIPNISRDIANATDPVQRNPKSLGEQLKMSIPGMRGDVTARVSTFGEVLGSNPDDPFVRGFVKITSKERPNELFDALKAANFAPDPAKNKQRGQTLDQVTFSRFQTRSGQLFAQKLKQAITDPDYQQLDAEAKQKTLQTALSDARSEALDEILGKPEKKPTLKVKRYD